MPIDSVCSGCGKTLRVNDEFVGRKARCPMCGMVYVVGGNVGGIGNVGGVGGVGGIGGVGNSADVFPTASDPFTTETTYATQNDANLPTLQPLSDSWSSLVTEKPQTIESSDTSTQAVAQPTQTTAQPWSANETASTSQATSPIPVPVAKFFVRTPNSMVYGPSDTETVLDWIKQGRLDDTCHIRDENSEQWLGMAAWRFQLRKLQNPVSSQAYQGTNQFGAAPVSTVQSAGYQKSGNGMVVLMLGVVSWLLCPTVLGALICAILAIVFATIELGRIRDGQSPSKEKTIVLIGLWLGIANLLASALLIVGFIIMVANAN